ncbi:MAG TPA: hypothetical protein VIX61_03985, partial [Casimicrobiaceae bacterium]
MLQTERYFGGVYGSFTLPAELDEANSTAKFDNCVLALKLAQKRPSGDASWPRSDAVGAPFADRAVGDAAVGAASAQPLRRVLLLDVVAVV